MSVGEMPAHNHSGSTNAINISGGFEITDGAYIGNAWGVFSQNTNHVWAKGGDERVGKGANFNSNHSHTVTINNTGSSQSHNNMMPYIAIYIWKRKS